MAAAAWQAEAVRQHNYVSLVTLSALLFVCHFASSSLSRPVLGLFWSLLLGRKYFVFVDHLFGMCSHLAPPSNSFTFVC